MVSLKYKIGQLSIHIAVTEVIKLTADWSVFVNVPR